MIYYSNPYSSNDFYGARADEAWLAVNKRRIAITCCSAALCPITCPVRTICGLACLIPAYLCCDISSQNKFCEFWKSIDCTPPYKSECSLLCYSVLYPFHCCPETSKFLKDPDESGLLFEHYATGPEKQAMSEGDNERFAKIAKRAAFEAELRAGFRNLEEHSTPRRTTTPVVKVTIEYGSI